MHAVAIESFQELSARWIWPALLHSVWIGLLVAAVCAIVVNGSARLSHGARYAILLVALALAILGPAVVTVFERRLAAVTATTAPELVITAQTAPGAERVSGPLAAHSPRTSNLIAAGRSRFTEFTAAWRSSCSSLATWAFPFVLAVWSCGVAIIAGFVLLGARAVRRLRDEAEPAGPEIQEKAYAMAQRLRIRRAPSVLIHSVAREPFLCGLIRPVIIVPESSVSHGRGELLDAILAHELAHARRLDHLVNLAQRVVEMFLFFHPAVHWISCALRRQREFCADALAARVTGDSLALARALESVALLRLSSPGALAGTSALGGQSSTLLPRIQELLGMKPARTRNGIWPLAALPAAAAFALFASSAGVAEDRPAADAPATVTAVRPSTSRGNEPDIAYEVRILSLDAQPWRDRVSDRLTLVQQDADVCVWIIDDDALFDILKDAQQTVTSNVLQAPKVIAAQNSDAKVSVMSKQHYVAQVEKVANGNRPAFRPVVKSVDIGWEMEVRGKLLERGADVSVSVYLKNLLAMHTLHREDRVGDTVIAAEYQVPTAVEKRCRVACEIPDGKSLIISLGLYERRGRSSNAAETANELLQSVGLPLLPARSVTCERLVSVKPRRASPSDHNKQQRKQTAPRIKPESASQPSPARR